MRFAPVHGEADTREQTMAESQYQGGARIAVEDYFDLRAWAKEFGVTPGDVRRAVSIVGNAAADVEAYFRDSGVMPLQEDEPPGYAVPSPGPLPARKPAHS
jgi:hypothetical protein